MKPTPTPETTHPEPENYCCHYRDPRPRWKQKLARLFINDKPDFPDLPEWAKDGVVINTRIDFSFADRLRILLSGSLRTQTFLACETPPDRNEAEMIIHTLPPIYLN